MKRSWPNLMSRSRAVLTTRHEISSSSKRPPRFAKDSESTTTNSSSKYGTFAVANRFCGIGTTTKTYQYQPERQIITRHQCHKWGWQKINKKLSLSVWMVMTMDKERLANEIPKLEKNHGTNILKMKHHNCSDRHDDRNPSGQVLEQVNIDRNAPRITPMLSSSKVNVKSTKQKLIITSA